MNKYYAPSAAGLFSAAALVLAAASILLPGGVRAGLFGATAVKASWNESEIKIDGSAAEWNGIEAAEKEGVALAAANDAANLYLYVAALDRDSAAQLSGRYGQAFTLWLDGKGGKKKVYGIRLTAKKPDNKEKKPSAPPGEASSGGKQPPEPRAVAYEAALVDADGVTRSLETDAVEFKSGLNSKKRAMFEFKVPLAKLFEKTGAVVGVGIETSEIDESAMPARHGSGHGENSGGPGGGSGMGGTPPEGGMSGGMGGPPPGGMGGGMGGGPGGGANGGPGMGGPGGGSGSSTPALPDPISFWLKVDLAAKGV